MKWCVCDGWASCLNILQFFVCTACPCKLSSGQLRLSDGIGSKFHVCKLLSVSRGMLETSEFCEPMYFGVLLLVLSRLKLSFANNSRFHLRWQLLQLILLVETGCGQVKSVHCILLRSSMNLMIYLPRFLCICNYFCFAGIVVETYQELWRKCLSSFCTSVYTFFTFFSFCCQSSFCNRVMISCSIHGVDELYSCNESLRNSSFLVEYSSPLMFLGLHEYRPIYRFEASAVKATRPILTREFSFQ